MTEKTTTGRVREAADVLTERREQLEADIADYLGDVEADTLTLAQGIVAMVAEAGLLADAPARLWALDVESLARLLADTEPSGGDRCFDEELRQGDPEMWEAHEDDRGYYREWARALLTESGTDQPTDCGCESDYPTYGEVLAAAERDADLRALLDQPTDEPAGEAQNGDDDRYRFPSPVWNEVFRLGGFERAGDDPQTHEDWCPGEVACTDGCCPPECDCIVGRFRALLADAPTAPAPGLDVPDDGPSSVGVAGRVRALADEWRRRSAPLFATGPGTQRAHELVSCAEALEKLLDQLTDEPKRPRRYDQCRGDCTADCGRCKGVPRTLGTLPGRCHQHFLTHCWDCGWITPAEAADLYRRGLAGGLDGDQPTDDEDPCGGTGTVECWSPGGPCEVPNEPGCETCGPCRTCQPTDEPEDTCRVVDVDGESVMVHVSREMDAKDREAFAEIVRAARRAYDRGAAPLPGGEQA